MNHEILYQAQWPMAGDPKIGWYYFLILLTNCCVAAIS